MVGVGDTLRYAPGPFGVCTTRCFDLRRYPCTITSWDDSIVTVSTQSVPNSGGSGSTSVNVSTYGAFVTHTMTNETYPYPFSTTRLMVSLPVRVVRREPRRCRGICQ